MRTAPARNRAVPAAPRRTACYTLAIILLILWLVGLVTSYTAGGLLHILLVVAIVMVVIQLFSGRRIG